MGAAASTTTNFGIVAGTSTGDIVFHIVAGGFRPGRHVVALYGDARGSFVNGDIDSYSPAAYTCFWVTTEDDPIVAYLDQINGTIAMVGDMQVDLAEIHAAITSVSGDVATIKTDVGTMKTSLTSLSTSISSVSSGMATLQTSIGSVQTSLASIDAVIGSMYGDLLTIDTTIGSFETSLDSIDATVSGLDSDVTALGSDMDALTGDVASIDTVLGSVAGTVTSMEGTLATIETDLGTVKVDLASAKTDIAAVETDVNDNLPVDMMPVWIAVILSLIAAIGAIAGVFIIQRKIA
jgi:chromosome segregation ATPase